MSRPADGGHRKSVVVVEVTPLEPPFSEDVAIYRFANDEKVLALSKADAELVEALLRNQHNSNAQIVLERAEDESKIRVHLTQ